MEAHISCSEIASGTVKREKEIGVLNKKNQLSYLAKWFMDAH